MPCLFIICVDVYCLDEILLDCCHDTRLIGVNRYRRARIFGLKKLQGTCSKSLEDRIGSQFKMQSHKKRIFPIENRMLHFCRSNVSVYGYRRMVSVLEWSEAGHGTMSSIGTYEKRPGHIDEMNSCD